MFMALIQKQMKILLRSPSELLILLLMPIVLICILSFALGSLMDGNSKLEVIELAVVEHENGEEAFRAFIEARQDRLPLDTEALTGLEESLPVGLLLKIFAHPELKEIIQVTNLDEKDLEKAKNSGEFSAILEIPEGFTSDYLNSLIFKKKQPAFNLYFNENEQVAAKIIKDQLELFQQQYTLTALLAENNLLSRDSTLPSSEVASSIRSVNSLEETSSSVYYTFSMTVMFILYVAGTMASQSFIEKNMNIFDRIVLARIQPSIYLLSIIASTIIISLLQVLILFVFSYLVFNVSFVQWDLYLLLTLMLSIVVGGIAALLSSVNYRANSASATNLFSTTVVAILAFFGGSYFNIASLSPMLAKVGMLTPNGAALDGYLTIAQNGTLEDLLPNITVLSITGILLFLVAFILFPKRGGHA